MSGERDAIEAQGLRLVLVHMGKDGSFDALLEKKKAAGLLAVADEERTLYGAFQVPRGRAGQIAAPKVWWRAVSAGLFGGHGVGRPVGDPFQMPGVVVLNAEEILQRYEYKTVADRPPYLELARAAMSV